MNSLDCPLFASVPEMLQTLRPAEPVYCIHPARYRQAARDFLAGFPGRVLYAVKVNDDHRVLKLLHEGGIRHFDCASLPEIALVQENCPDSTCYFMIPVWLRGAASEAFKRHGVRHFVVDCMEGLETLNDEVPMEQCVVFVRMAAHHKSAMNDLSTKFGAREADMPGLLQAVRESSAEPALAFNVGSQVTDPEAYRTSIDAARRVLEAIPFEIRLLDIGGGYPFSYPGFELPGLEKYWDAIREAVLNLPLSAEGEVLTEPGRALAAPGLSAVSEVLQRKTDRLYLNDGCYGIFWELRYPGHDRYPVTVYRDHQVYEAETSEFTLYGPTCDAYDVLPGKVRLPCDIRAGDFLEFSNIGAYSLSGRTRFNQQYSETIVGIGD